MKYFLIAGEASGDSHGSRLIDEIKILDAAAEFEFWGGDKMAQSTGKTPNKHFKDLAFMGFVEVIKNLHTIRSNFKKIKTEVLAFQPDRIVYIDYPGFNLRLVKWAKNLGFHNSYYISPTVWAWKPSRKELIRKYVDELLVILPFEKKWYHQFGIEVHYVGNPVVEQVKAFQKDPDFKTKNNLGPKVIALLPGSRKQEISAILPVMLAAAAKLPEHFDLVIAKPGFLSMDAYSEVLSRFPNIKIHLIENQFYNILSISELAMVASGTATLETALFNVPQVVCYKTGIINYTIAKMLVKLKYISLVNLICEEEIVPELIQNNLSVDTLVMHLKKIIDEPSNTSYHQLHQLLETITSPSKIAAEMIVGSNIQ